MIDPKLIAQLRSLTGAGIVDCQKALTESNGDYDKAVDLLRTRGQKVAANKGSRETHEGLVHCYTHANNKVGAMVEVLCETDFVARNEDFIAFAHDLVLQIVATNPLYLRPEDVPAEMVDRERAVYAEQLAAESKPEEMKEKIITGKLNKFYQEICLLKQPFIKDDSVTIEELVTRQIAKIGENIQIRRFSRFAI